MFKKNIMEGSRKRKSILLLSLIIAAFTIILSACSTGTQAPTSTATTTSTGSHSAQSNAYSIAIRDGWQVSLFASATSSYTQPDSVVVNGGHVFIGYQNNAAKDGSDTIKSTIVEYSMDGKVLKTFSAPGHSDGMRMDPTTKLLWVTSNEDGNPKMETIAPASGTITPYTLPNAPHGGGFDDVYFLNGLAFIAASNPNLDKNGNNVFPALDKISLSNGKAVLTPVLMGNATATDITNGANNAQVSLNEVDPDSLTVDTKGNLILVNQGGSEIVMISNPGTSQQKVSRLAVGTQLDDTVWATSTQGRLLVADGTSGRTFWLRAPRFTVGDVFTQTPDDSGVVGLVGAVDMSTGFVTPIALGFDKPTGMIFVPDGQN